MSGLETSIWAPENYYSSSSNRSSYTFSKVAPVSTTHSRQFHKTSKNQGIGTTREIISDDGVPYNGLWKNSRGLSASRWAPRDYPGRPKAANRQEVWTMVSFHTFS